MPAKSASARAVPSVNAPRILCTGIIVLDQVFRVEEFPRYDGKVEAQEFFIVNGGCAAVAVARLGSRALLAGPLGGPAGADDNGDRVMAALAREHVDTTACQRVDGLPTALSAIFIDARVSAPSSRIGTNASPR
jgi:sulfofructose kinase